MHQYLYYSNGVALDKCGVRTQWVEVTLRKRFISYILIYVLSERENKKNKKVQIRIGNKINSRSSFSAATTLQQRSYLFL